MQMRAFTVFVLFLPQCGIALEQQQVLDQLIGNFNYLINVQVTCDGSYAKGNYICNKDIPGERRILGTWDSYIVPVAIENTYPMRFVDSNLFVTTQTLLPLFSVRFADAGKEKLRSNAIHNAMTAINLFQRNDGFSFWPQIGPSQQNQVNRIGPLNLSPILLGTQLEIITATEDFLHINLFPDRVRWMRDNIDLDNKDSGFDALFNVPNDTDDTALAIASNFHFYREHPDRQRFEKFIEMSRTFARYVDTWETRNDRRYREYLPECKSIVLAQQSLAERQALFADNSFMRNCSLDDPREAWRYDAYSSPYSGAFLTWRYDESKPIYDDPEAGVSLTGQNSVDCVAIANVVYSLSLTKVRDEPAIRPAYVNSCNAIANTILDQNNELRLTKNPRSSDGEQVAVWKSCGLFFPAQMTFPYMVSRAVGDAGACQDLDMDDQRRFNKAMLTLIDTLIAEQDDSTGQKERGQWFEPIDQSIALPTALGGISLLNFANTYPELLASDSGNLQERIAESIAYTIALSESDSSTEYGQMVSLPEGTYFGGGTVDEIAHWRSKAFATAVSLELMTKYLARYSDLPVDGQILTLGSATNSDHQSHNAVEALPDAYKQDSLSPAVQSRHKLTAGIAFRGGFRGPEGGTNIEYSHGEHLRIDFQEKDEQVARYDIKLRAWAIYQFDDDEVDNFGIELKFHGISTDTNFVVQDDVAHFPITYSQQYGVETKSIHWRYGALSAPIWKIGDEGQLNIDASARLVGFVDREKRQSATPTYRKSINLADFSAGVTYINNRASASTWIATALGYSRDSAGEKYFSMRNYSLGASLRFAFLGNHAFSFTAIRRVDGRSGDLFDDDQAYLEYAYKWE